MHKPGLWVLIGALAALAAGCWNDDGDHTGSPEPGASYTVTVIDADVVNKDSGAGLEVGGMPLEGGTLVVE
jgi:hypothetical protein